MTSFAPHEATTTAEPPEPLSFRHSEFIVYTQNLQQIDGPAARHIGVHSCPFVVPDRYKKGASLSRDTPFFHRRKTTCRR